MMIGVRRENRLTKMLAAVVMMSGAVVGAAADRPTALDKPAPETLEDLRVIQERTEAVAEKAAPATVALDLGIAGTGSGVVVSEDGYVLTAAHVIGDAGQLVQVRFPDGSTATGRTLGSDQQNDAGLVKLQGDGPWPFVPMAEPDTLAPGDWVVALGHPGGFDEDRTVVVRLGRIVRVRKVVGLMSDCSLIGGDSGGPLFNTDGEVVGIHSRIGQSERTNIHVPISEYHTGWDRLAAGRQWGRRQMPLLGVLLDPDNEERGVLVQRVFRDSAAARAGMKRGDIIVRVDDQPMLDDRTIHEYMALQVPGDPVVVTVLRDNKEIQLEATLGEFPE